MNAARKPAPARFAVDPRRRALIGKVHVAKTQLGLDDDLYRSILLDVAGRRSAADCTEAELLAVLRHFESRGFAPKPKSGAPRRADHASARKARSLWISLHQLGVITNSSEKALEAFARRQLGVDRLQWANQSQCYSLIEALKAMAQRAGWDQSLADVRPGMHATVLKRRLVEAQLAKIAKAGLAPAEWGVVRAAKEFAGIELPGMPFTNVEQLQAVAQAFAEVLRTAPAKVGK
jgi:phage gp16-like protein